MPHSALLQRVLQAQIELPSGALERPLIHVDSKSQSLQLVAPDGAPLMSCPVSTSRNGLGQENGSYQTPTGIHRICEKIGDNEPSGRVFRGRQAQPQLCLPEDYDGETDVITTRILWLDGLQPGLNQGGQVDSRERYIYIHGTPDEARIGQPASIGCLRMKNDDIVSLYEQVNVDDLVIID